MALAFLIIGGGVAGTMAAQAIKRAEPEAAVDVYTDEPTPYYRRPLLWEFIAGAAEEHEIVYRPLDWYDEHDINLHLETPVKRIDADSHLVYLAGGREASYDRLLLATGARAFVPPCTGLDLEGVFSLRTLADAAAIREYAQESRRAVVVGGGLLGLETARALRDTGLQVTVLEMAPRLLPRQLDVEGARLLSRILHDQGLHTVVGVRAKALQGARKVTGVLLDTGQRIGTDLVIFSVGIRCNTALAENAGAEIGRGVFVDPHMRTSLPDVFAAGDVTEFAGHCYGIVPAAVDQARVAAANMVKENSRSYDGSLPTTTLKVAGAEVTSLGQCVAEDGTLDVMRHIDEAHHCYRKLVLDHGRPVGAILLNSPQHIAPVRTLIERSADVTPYAARMLEDDFDPPSIELAQDEASTTDHRQPT